MKQLAIKAAQEVSENWKGGTRAEFSALIHSACINNGVNLSAVCYHLGISTHSL